jgi:hypothetical protein
MEVTMKVVNVKEDMKRPMSDTEAKARVAWYRDWSKRLDEVNAESPMPDDILEYCEGRKFRPLPQYIQAATT